MAELTFRPEEIAAALRRNLEGWSPELEGEAIGFVATLGDDVARVTGLPNTMANELLEFPGGLLGVALNLDETSIGAVLMGDSSHIYEGDPVRVKLDDRDLRGGEKAWQHIKRGVPLRLEIGPRDIKSGSVFLGRRDRPPREKSSVPRDRFVATVADTLAEIQAGLFDRALQLRLSNTCHIDDAALFLQRRRRLCYPLLL